MDLEWSDSVDFINKDLTKKGPALVCKLISIPIAIHLFSDIKPKGDVNDKVSLSDLVGKRMLCNTDLPLEGSKHAESPWSVGSCFPD